MGEHHAPDDPVRLSHEAQMRETAATTHANSVSLARINGSLEKVADRVSGLADRVTGLGQQMSDVRADLRLQAEERRESLAEIREVVRGQQEQFANYLEECREYRMQRHRVDIERDLARGLKVHEPAPPGDGEDEDLSWRQSVSFALRQPWFWATFLGLAFGLGGFEAIKMIVQHFSGN